MNQMNDRDKTSEQLTAYMDGQLSPAESRCVEQMLEKDAELARELAELRATRELVRSLGVERAPEDFVARVLAQAERKNLMGPREKARQRHRFGWVRWAATAAVLVITVGAGIFIAQALRSANRFQDRIARNGQADREIARTTDDARRWDKSGFQKGDKNGRDLKRAGPETFGKEPGGRPGDSEGAGKGDRVRIAKGGSGYAKDGGSLSVLSRKASEDLLDTAFANTLRGALPAVPADKLANVTNEDIYTDDLAVVQRDVENILIANGVRRMTLNTYEPVAQQREAIERRNVFLTNLKTERQVQYIAFVTRDQAMRIQRDIGSNRSRQRVSQAAVAVGEKLHRLQKALDDRKTQQPGSDEDATSVVGGGVRGREVLAPAPAAAPRTESIEESEAIAGKQTPGESDDSLAGIAAKPSLAEIPGTPEAILESRVRTTKAGASQPATTPADADDDESRMNAWFRADRTGPRESTVQPLEKLAAGKAKAETFPAPGVTKPFTADKPDTGTVAYRNLRRAGWSERDGLPQDELKARPGAKEVAEATSRPVASEDLGKIATTVDSPSRRPGPFGQVEADQRFKVLDSAGQIAKATQVVATAPASQAAEPDILPLLITLNYRAFGAAIPAGPETEADMKAKASNELKSGTDD